MAVARTSMTKLLKIGFSVSMFLIGMSTANAGSLYQENGHFAAWDGSPWFGRKTIAVDHEAAVALYDLLSQVQTPKQDGEDGLSNSTVTSGSVSCRRSSNLVINASNTEFHVVTSCTIVFASKWQALVYRTPDGKIDIRFGYGSIDKDLIGIMAKAKDVTKSTDGTKYSYENGALTCNGGAFYECDLIETDDRADLPTGK
jgi:hypothetical protein